MGGAYAGTPDKISVHVYFQNLVSFPVQIYGSLAEHSLSVLTNIYHTDLIPHLQGQASQYLTL
jgi:hypothetical protein